MAQLVYTYINKENVIENIFKALKENSSLAYCRFKNSEDNSIDPECISIKKNTDGSKTIKFEYFLTQEMLGSPVPSPEFGKYNGLWLIAGPENGLPLKKEEKKIAQIVIYGAVKRNYGNNSSQFVSFVEQTESENTLLPIINKLMENSNYQKIDNTYSWNFSALTGFVCKYDYFLYPAMMAIRTNNSLNANAQEIRYLSCTSNYSIGGLECSFPQNTEYSTYSTYPLASMPASFKDVTIYEDDSYNSEKSNVGRLTGWKYRGRYGSVEVNVDNGTSVEEADQFALDEYNKFCEENEYETAAQLSKRTPVFSKMYLYSGTSSATNEYCELMCDVDGNLFIIPKKNTGTTSSPNYVAAYSAELVIDKNGKYHAPTMTSEGEYVSTISEEERSNYTENINQSEYLKTGEYDYYGGTAYGAGIGAHEDRELFKIMTKYKNSTTPIYTLSIQESVNSSNSLKTTTCEKLKIPVHIVKDMSVEDLKCSEEYLEQIEKYAIYYKFGLNKQPDYPLTVKDFVLNSFIIEPDDPDTPFFNNGKAGLGLAIPLGVKGKWQNLSVNFSSFLTNLNNKVYYINKIYLEPANGFMTQSIKQYLGCVNWDWKRRLQEYTSNALSKGYIIDSSYDFLSEDGTGIVSSGFQYYNYGKVKTGIIPQTKSLSFAPYSTPYWCPKLSARTAYIPNVSCGWTVTKYEIAECEPELVYVTPNPSLVPNIQTKQVGDYVLDCTARAIYKYKFSVPYIKHIPLYPYETKVVYHDTTLFIELANTAEANSNNTPRYEMREATTETLIDDNKFNELVVREAEIDNAKGYYEK